MNEDAIKNAFEKIKQDMFFLGSEIGQLKTEILDIKKTISYLDENITQFKLKSIVSTYNPQNSTHTATSTHNSTDNYHIQPLRTSNTSISMGNRGASTDRQTDRQTDRNTQNYPQNSQKPINQSISEASEALESLDILKKEIRLKFKQITPQEMLVFSTIYQLEEQGVQDIDYLKLATKLGLSQSSIRDYIQRIINKGIPIHKIRLNNKKIVLSVSPELKKVASLDTILQLREI